MPLSSPLLQTPQAPPLGLYIHFPWCIRKCPYCDFNSHAVKEAGIPQKAYFDALLADLWQASQGLKSREVQSIFIGGGTPSLMEPDLLARLLEGVAQYCTLSTDCEITLEANPGTFELERFHAFQQAGITRLSLGIQSLNDQKLQAIGRIHDAAQAKKAIEVAQKFFNSFNLDLMYALPNQSLEELKQDLHELLAFQPPHLSIYHLTIESNTYFAKHPPQVPEDDLAFQMLDLITEQTIATGLKRYEVSAYAKAEHQCRHNCNYWEYGDYLGIGAGAHGKVTLESTIKRYTKYRDPYLYMNKALEGNPTSHEHEVLPEDRIFEFMLNALRLKEGVLQKTFALRTGIPLENIRPQLQEAIKKGLLSDDPNRLKATEKGFDFLSDLQEMFLHNSI